MGPPAEPEDDTFTLFRGQRMSPPFYPSAAVLPFQDVHAEWIPNKSGKR